MIMDKAILYKIKKSKRARQIRIAVHSDGKVIVTSPFGIKESIVNSFILKKKQLMIDNGRRVEEDFVSRIQYSQ